MPSTQILRSVYRVFFSIVLLSSTVTTFPSWAKTKALSPEAIFVKERITIAPNCPFKKKYILQMMRDGMKELDTINPSFAAGIRARVYPKDMTISCDVTKESQVPAPNYSAKDNTIHMWASASPAPGSSSDATMFHEFLHASGIHHMRGVPKATYDSDKIYGLDWVYACQLATFPKMVQIWSINPETLTIAREKCSRVDLEELVPLEEPKAP